MNHITFLIIGLSGDLARRKLLPAIYQLVKHHRLPSFLIFGVGRETTDSETILEQSRPFISNIDEKIFQTIKQQTFYNQIDLFDKKDFAQLIAEIEQKELGLTVENKMHIVYCATASSVFSEIIQRVSETNFIRTDCKQDIIVFEKPFGSSLADAQSINHLILQHFSENQVFRVDHYLTKELVRAIVNLRFSNSIFEPLLNSNFVEQVQIIASEEIGIEGRAFYYDRYGAIQDMIQNHLLSLLSLIIFEKPEKLDPLSLSKARADSLKIALCKDGLLGQYEGYKKESDVKTDSNTETFAALSFSVENPRWKDVPFLLKTGKYLDKKETVILVKFKPLFPHQKPNWLKIQISPEAIISVSLHLRSPQSDTEMMTVPMEFCHSCLFSDQTQEAYEQLLYAIIRQDKAVAVQPDEIEAAWHITEHIIAKKLPLLHYQKGSSGPVELQQWYKKQQFDTQY